MIYYHIILPATASLYVFSKEEILHGVPKGKHALLFEYDDLENLFFTTSGGSYFSTTDFKEKFESSSLKGLSFSPIDILLYAPHREKEFKNLSAKSFWKVNISADGEIKDFFLQEGIFLIISDKAWEFLSHTEAFRDLIAGEKYGDDFKILTNRFLVSDEVGNYTKADFFKMHNEVDLKLKKIRDEYRRREGLPPIN